MGISSQKNRTAFSEDNEGFLRSFKSSLEWPIREHLMKVYTCLWMSHLAAAAGACFHIFNDTLSENLLPLLIGVAFMVTLSKTPKESGKNFKTRVGLLFGISFFIGLGLKPLLGIIINIHPGIIAIVILSTNQILACFSLCALIFPGGQYLFLGGPLLSLLILLTDAIVFYYSSGSMMLFDFYLNMGLTFVCGLLLYDTHRIIEKHRLGDEDYVSHSTDLFSNVFDDIFRFLRSILAKKEEDDKERLIGRSAKTRI